MTTLNATYDTTIDQTDPSTPKEGASLLYVRAVTNEYKHAYFNFDLSSENNTLVSATLWVSYYDPVTDCSVYIRRITSTWTASTVTWNTKATTTTTNQVAKSFIHPGGWTSVDVTQLIKDCINNTNYGLEFYPTDTDGSSCGIKSIESPGSYDAYLIISYGNKYIDISTGSDSDDGNSWANAYLTVKKGIDNVTAGKKIHIAEGNYSAQAAINLNKNLELVCEDYGGGNASPPLTVTLPPTA